MKIEDWNRNENDPNEAFNEQNIELLRNIRDSNNLNNRNWLSLSNYSTSSILEYNKYYILENNFDVSSPVKITDVSFPVIDNTDESTSSSS